MKVEVLFEILADYVRDPSLAGVFHDALWDTGLYTDDGYVRWLVGYCLRHYGWMRDYYAGEGLSLDGEAEALSDVKAMLWNDLDLFLDLVTEEGDA